MIIKVISRMDEAGGLVRYLAGKGHENEHTDQHTVAGTVHYQGDLGTDKDLVAQIAADLRAHSQTWPDTKISEGKIWHATISVPPADGVLSDGRWRQIAEDYMTRLGLTDPRKSPIQWSAVRHGMSAEGNDHVHIVANLVRADGTKANVWNAYPKSQKIAAELEYKYGLSVLSTRHSRSSSVPLTKAEIKAAEKADQEPARLKLERLTRAHAGASATEAEFVRRMRADNILIRPRVQDNEVTGFSVGLAGYGKDGGPVYFAAGRLARDLTLPRLRTGWDHTDADARSAADEWSHGRTGRPVVRYGRETQPPPPTTVGDVTSKFTALRQQISTATLPELGQIAGDLSGVLAAASRAAEPTPGPLAQASRKAGSYAGTRGYNPERGGNPLRDIAMLMMVLKDPSSEGAQQVMFRQVLLTLMALSRAHHKHATTANSTNQPTAIRRGIMTSAEKSDEALEGLATMGVTIGAMSIATALNKVKSKGSTHITEEERAGMDTAQRRQTQGAKNNPAPARANGIKDLTGPANTEQGQTQTQTPVKTGPQAWKTAAEPMTDNQLEGIKWRSRRLGIDPYADIDSLEDFTKADASEAITALDKALKDGASKDQARVLLLTPDTPVTTSNGTKAQGITQATPPSPMDWKGSGDKLRNSAKN